MSAPVLHHIGFKVVTSYLLYWGVCNLEQLNKNQAASVEALRDISLSLKEINITLQTQTRNAQFRRSTQME